jgi:hypothetical protein
MSFDRGLECLERAARFLDLFCRGFVGHAFHHAVDFGAETMA